MMPLKNEMIHANKQIDHVGRKAGAVAAPAVQTVLF